MLRRLHPEQPESFAFTAANQQWAEAQITNLPGKLDQAARFFGSHEKNMAGHKLMMRLSKPRPAMLSTNCPCTSSHARTHR